MIELKKFFALILFLTILSCINNQSSNDLFEGIDKDSPLNHLILFNPGNSSLISLDKNLFNLAITTQTIPNECLDTFLDYTKTYQVIKPNNKTFDSLDIKLPFTSILANSILFDKNNFCLLYNKKNMAIVFNLVIPVPCMISLCYIKLISVSFSTENGLVMNNFKPIRVYDTIRYHYVTSPQQFGMRFQLGFPLYSSPLAFYGFDDDIGFHFRMTADLNIIGQIVPLNFLGIKLTNTRFDVFIQGKNIISFQNNLDINGLLRDSQTDAFNTCFPSGIFFSASNDLRPTSILGSKFLAGIIGSTLMNFQVNLDAGYLFNMRTNQNNGLFIRGLLSVSLFHVFKVSIEMEVQFLNKNELNRRLKSLEASSLCSDPEITPLSSILLGKFARAQDSELLKSSDELRDWNRFFFTRPSSFYFGMYLKAKASVNLPLMNIFLIKGTLSGHFITPSPRNPGDMYYGEISASANVLMLVEAGVTWSISDRVTNWNCYGKIPFFTVEVHIQGPSIWLFNHGSLLQMEKSVKSVKMKPNLDPIKKIIKLVQQTIKKVGQVLGNMYNGIKNSVKEGREKAKKLTDKLCRNPPCLLSNLLANVFGGLSSFGTAFNAVFGRTKRITTLHSYNEFNCPIWRVQIKKCVWKSCSTIGYEYNEDKPCMDRVKATLLEAQHLEQLADWKEEVVQVNMASNAGLLYALEELEAGNNIFDENDIKFEDILHEFNVTDYSKYRIPRSNFDPNNTDFFDEFDNDMNDIFDEFDDTDEDIDISQVYRSDQNFNVTTIVTINTSRLSGIFKGKDNITVKFTVPANFDFESQDSLERTSDLFFEQLVEQEGALFEAIKGENVGITDDLTDAYGMNPPIITLRNPLNPTIYCDDPEIDPYYASNDTMLIQGLRKYLTPLYFEQIYKRCKSDIIYNDDAFCEEHEEICGATKCVFTRTIFDGCGQKSNEVFENVTVLPRKPFFETFPSNIPLSCAETKNVTHNLTRFIIPDINSGCRNVDTDFYYEDSDIDGNCVDTIHRKWRVEMIGCENSLYNTRSQKMYIEDNISPIFSEFPADKNLNFFDSYGTDDTGVPKVYDSCGHGPSELTYTDQVQFYNGERLVNRIWSTKDTCGNQNKKIQSIRIKNEFKNDLNSNFKNFLIFSFNQSDLTNVDIHGPVGSKEKISLLNSSIGNDQEFEDKCVKRQKWVVLSGKRITTDDSIIHGPIKSLSDFDFDTAYSQAIGLTRYFNDSIRSINIGTSDFKCHEEILNLNQEFPVDNYMSSTCAGTSYKYFPIHIIDEKFVSDELTSIELKGNELIYNVFYFKNPKIFEDKSIRINVPETSVIVINFENKNTVYLNRHKIIFNIDSNVRADKIIYNFVSDGDIVFEESDDNFGQIDGTILAPYSNFIKLSNRKKEGENFLNGQLFAKNIYINGLKQICTIFEPNLD